jgi:plasmid stabilization system protein ParE
MSAHKRRVVLAPLAADDFDDILLYTKQQWGDEQRNEYFSALSAAFDELARFPHLGVRRPDLGPTAHSLRVRQHILVFHVSETELNITRIVHVRQDLNAELDL